MRIRPIHATDASALIGFHLALTERTVYFRFFGLHPQLSDAEAAHFCGVDYEARFALVAESDGGFVGVARYDGAPGSAIAEVAFVVADAYQSRGLGTLLLENLAVAARERGITHFTAETLATNAPMQGVFRRAGFHSSASMSHGVSEVGFDIAPTQRYLEAVVRRDWGTFRPMVSGTSGGVGVISSSTATQKELHAQCARVGADISASVVIGEPGGPVDLVEALATVVGAGTCHGIAIATSGLVLRPRTFVVAARMAGGLMPVAATGLAEALAEQSGISAVSDLAGLAGQTRDLQSARRTGRWTSKPAASIEARAGFDSRRAHRILVDASHSPPAQRLPVQLTVDLLAAYGIPGGRLMEPGNPVVIVVTDDSLGLGINMRSGDARLLTARRLLPLTTRDVGELAACGLAHGANILGLEDVLSRLARLVDDQPQIFRVEMTLGSPPEQGRVWTGRSRGNGDNPFMRCLPITRITDPEMPADTSLPQ